MLGLMGHIKYEEITEMTLPMRVEGIICNFLQEEDEHKVISKCCYPPLPRYDPRNAVPLEGETKGDLRSFLIYWAKMDLSHIYGFPLWEEGVFHLLHENFEAMRSIFDYYAKSGGGGQDAGARLTRRRPHHPWSPLQMLTISGPLL
jgi:hypothetical protein